MKITAISDTHTKHQEITRDLKGGDVLIHSGDFMSSGYNKYEIMLFLDWFNDQNYKHKIFIAGNHDRLFESSPELCNEILENFPDVIYLQDSAVVIDDIKFYGLPWTPEFMGWAFPLPLDDDSVAISHMNKIHNDTDVLITHGPGYMLRDHIPFKGHVGCKHLAKRINELNLRYHIFGHIHESYGGMIAKNGKTAHLNVSVLNGHYNYTNKPVDLEIDNDT